MSSVAWPRSADHPLTGDRAGVNALYFVHTDHLGSSSLLTTEDGQEVPGTRLRYYAYGGPRPGTADATHNAFAHGYTPAAYTGQTRDASTRLMYYGTRFYDPHLRAPPPAKLPHPPAALDCEPVCETLRVEV